MTGGRYASLSIRTTAMSFEPILSEAGQGIRLDLQIQIYGVLVANETSPRLPTLVAFVPRRCEICGLRINGGSGDSSQCSTPAERRDGDMFQDSLRSNRNTLGSDALSLATRHIFVRPGVVVLRHWKKSTSAGWGGGVVKRGVASTRRETPRTLSPRPGTMPACLGGATNSNPIGSCMESRRFIARTRWKA